MFNFTHLCASCLFFQLSNSFIHSSQSVRFRFWHQINKIQKYLSLKVKWIALTSKSLFLFSTKFSCLLGWIGSLSHFSALYSSLHPSLDHPLNPSLTPREIFILHFVISSHFLHSPQWLQRMSRRRELLWVLSHLLWRSVVTNPSFSSLISFLRRNLL